MSNVHITLFAALVTGVLSGCKPSTRATPSPAPAVQPPATQQAAVSAPHAATNEAARVAPEPPAPEPPPPPEGMVYVPGGTVTIGRPRSISASAKEPERVEVSPFFIDCTEVTVDAYLKCVKAGDCKLPGHETGCNGTGKKPRLKHPMNCIDKLMAERYCATQGKRLPSTAEWQLAAGGTDGRSYPWGNEAAREQVCWEANPDAPPGTCPVGSYPQGASPYGALDMAGNVAEWTSTVNPDGAPAGSYCRGGSYWVDDMELAQPETLHIRVDESSTASDREQTPTIGARCAKDL